MIINEIKKLIKNSKLIEEDQNDLIASLELVPQENQTELIKIFEKKPELIYSMMDNLTLKRIAIQKGDKNLWENIITEEERLLSELA